MKFQIWLKSGRNRWWEEIDKNVKNPEKWAVDTIDSFNESLRPGELPRKLLAVEILSEKDGPSEHEWEKSNLITVSDSSGYYDTYKCAFCKVTARRYGLGSSFSVDKKFKANKYKFCRGR